MSKGSKFLVWGYTYGALWVEEEDSLEDAVSYAKAGEDMGSHSFSHIEEVGVGRVSGSDVRAVWDRLRDEDVRERDFDRKATHLVDLRTLDGDGWAVLRAAYEGEPDVSVEIARFGADRIRVREVRS